MDTGNHLSAWEALLALRDGGADALPAGPLAALFGPVLAPPAAADGCRVIGRLAQTLDGRIATAGGSSQWIGGPGDILHTHRLRALCHAVVVGAGTVRHDNPRLTTREAPGPDPLRVVLDTDRKLSADYGIFQGRPRCWSAPPMRGARISMAWPKYCACRAPLVAGWPFRPCLRR
jgi:hypothetical protein